MFQKKNDLPQPFVSPAFWGPGVGIPNFSPRLPTNHRRIAYANQKRMTILWMINNKISPLMVILVGGFSPTRLKNMTVKLDHFCRDPGENKKYGKPPPSLFLAETWFLQWKKSCTTGDKLPINWLAGFLPSTVSQLLHLEFSQPCKTQNQTLFLLRPDDSSLGPHQCGQVHRRVHHI